MKIKPMSLKILTVFFLAITISMPIQIMVLYQHSIFELSAALAKLTPLNWMVMVTSMVAAWLSFSVSPLSWVVIPFLCILVVQNNWLVAEIGTDYSAFQAGLASGLFLICSVSPLLLPQNRLIFGNPKLRWWLTPSRKKITLPVSMNLSKIRGNSYTELKSRTFDISETGAFVMFENFENSKTLPEVGSRFTVVLGKNPIRCEVEVVRVNVYNQDEEQRPNYPTGIGVKFKNLNASDRHKIKE